MRLTTPVEKLEELSPTPEQDEAGVFGRRCRLILVVLYFRVSRRYALFNGATRAPIRKENL